MVALWENGYPRYRLYDDISDAHALTDVIVFRTDLKPKKIPASNASNVVDDSTASGETALVEEEQDEFLQQFDAFKDRNATDWFVRPYKNTHYICPFRYLIAAVVTLIFNGVYFAMSSTRVRTLLTERLRNVVPWVA